MRQLHQMRHKSLYLWPRIDCWRSFLRNVERLDVEEVHKTRAQCTFKVEIGSMWYMKMLFVVLYYRIFQVLLLHPRPTHFPEIVRFYFFSQNKLDHEFAKCIHVITAQVNYTINTQLLVHLFQWRFVNSHSGNAGLQLTPPSLIIR